MQAFGCTSVHRIELNPKRLRFAIKIWYTDAVASMCTRHNYDNICAATAFAGNSGRAIVFCFSVKCVNTKNLWVLRISGAAVARKWLCFLFFILRITSMFHHGFAVEFSSLHHYCSGSGVVAFDLHRSIILDCECSCIVLCVLTQVHSQYYHTNETNAKD